MQLIYRAQVFEFAPAPTEFSRPLRAVNWRFWVSKEIHVNYSMLDYSDRRRPRALNWRFCLPVEV
ncbi:MAG: hypothetical protein HC866_00455 [Leptolyngbyaceae cyanobacterium RU_5_1]|nr:hypothetical protein [Leptolyngbyaceae cyanobacterium RU_5_1]